jgi:hypothetical protein
MKKRNVIVNKTTRIERDEYGNIWEIHRCKGKNSEDISRNVTTDEPDWATWEIDMTDTTLRGLSYCPFCGKKLVNTSLADVKVLLAKNNNGAGI